MAFGPDHYVPVLKVKAGEKAALRAIAASLRERITPLLEIVERKALKVKKVKVKTIDKHLTTAFKGLAASVRLYPRCFLDLREIAPDGATAASKAFRMAVAEGIVFTPVTGLSRTADIAAALSVGKDGVALRLKRQECESGNLPSDLAAFMKKHRLVPENTDLIIDLGPVDDLVVDGVAALSDVCLAAVPDHKKWRTFTLSACAFPQSMGVVDRNSHSHVERAEWIAWRDRLHVRRAEVVRLPTFSDCAIQYPTGVEGFDFRLMQVSASIRYTLDETWLLVKGVSTRTMLPSEQFPVLAKRLVYGSFRPQFAGPSHCKGCESMKAAADGGEDFGSAGAWRRLGTIHHITKAIEGIAALPSP